MAIVTVGSTAELYDALESAVGGDSIKLTAGDYGDVNLSNFSFNSEVTITSANLKNPAVIGSLNVYQSDNITFDNLFFDFVPDMQTLEWSSAIKINQSSGITVQNSTLEGGVSIAGVPADSEPGEQNEFGILGEPVGRGITAENSSGLSFIDNDISNFTRGIVIGSNNDVVVSGNEIHDLRASPLVGSDNNNTLVEDNHFYNFNPWKLGGLGDHGDMIHFWTTTAQTGATTNLIIRNNLFEEGDGQSLLGIYLEDNFGKTFTNVVIEDNVIHLGDSQAIRLEGVVGGTLENNTLIQSSGGTTDQPLINLAAGTQDLIVQNNISAGIYGTAFDAAAANGISIVNNLTVTYDDPQADTYVGNLFVEGVPSGDNRTSLVISPDSAADGYGADMSQYDVTPATVQAFFQVSSLESDANTVVFDAGISAGPDGILDPAETDYYWTFGDGTVSTGPLVQRTYDQPGNFNVSLKVVASDGSISTSSYVIGVAGDLMVSYDNSTGEFVSHAYGAEEENSTPDLELKSVGTKTNVVLGATGVQAEIAATELEPLFGTDNFSLDMTLRSTVSSANSGEIFRVHGSFMATVDSAGNLVFDMFDEGGNRITAVTSGVSMTDGTPHDISIVFDGDANSLKILVDGQLRASEVVTGDLNDFPRSLTIGNPWNEPNFQGQLSEFSISSSQPEYTIFDGLESSVNKTVMDEETGLPAAGAGIGEYVLDIESLDGVKGVLRDDAAVVMTPDGPVLEFDGEKDLARLGRQADYEDVDLLSVSVDFSRDVADGQDSKIFWNAKQLGLKVVDDGLVVRAATTDQGFKTFKVKDIGLNDTDWHNAVVLVDSVEDRMQVIIDGVLVLDETDTDFDVTGTSDWRLSAGGVRSLDGQISDFRLDDTDAFIAGQVYGAESGLFS